MPLYMDIHKNVTDTIPEDVAAAHHQDVETQGAFGVKYLRWWFNRDAGSIYCLVDAPNAESAMEVHKQSHGLMPDEIIPVESGDVEDFIGPDQLGPALQEQPPGSISTDSVFRTVVFTDLEGSTNMTQRLGDEAALELLQRHDELMSSCVDEHSGRRVKHTGDGLMASFVSVAKAVQCMIDMQRALVRHNESEPSEVLRARMGAAAGEPVSHHDDLFGATVQLAARLCDYGTPGQILVPSVVRDLCIGKTFKFDSLGDVPMKGFEEPVRVYSVSWQ
ncbi:MAG: nickel-binding protein [Dehalococcoidia bacterium]